MTDLPPAGPPGAPPGSPSGLSGAGDISPVALEEEMKRSYLDYAMSVIVARALPDARDGLKPVQRRILYGMYAGGYRATAKLRKCAAIVGDVMKNFHPHGDGAIYDALVRMAQDFTMRLPLIDKQGNFGSVDGDPPAQMRYTECRLARAAEALLEDIGQDTVDFEPTYDEESTEPLVLPARFPNLLVNGAGGIAVGMATSIPPHNLGEVIDGCLAMLDNPGIMTDELMQLVPGPDFPTGGVILGRSGIRAAYHTGNGSITVRARTNVEEIRKDRWAVIATELPYQVNKAKLQERMAEQVHEKVLEGISDIRDESDRDGMRLVVELKRDAMADVVAANLFRHTAFQQNFSCNMVALDGGRPRTMGLRDLIRAFVTFREEVVVRRTRHLLGQARERAHVLAGLAVAVANIDAIVAMIRNSPDPEAARAGLTGRPWPAEEVAPILALLDDPGQTVGEDGTYRLSERQARAILDLRLQRLTGLERDKIGDELREVMATVTELLGLLSDRTKLLDLIRAELRDIKDRFATPRRTTIEDLEFEPDIEALIQREEVVVAFTIGGYVKRMALSTFRAQRRGGKGRAGMAMKEEDLVNELVFATTHTPMLFFTTRGVAFMLKVWRLPEGTPQSRGKALVNLLRLEPGETVATVLPLPEDTAAWEALDVVFVTNKGNVRRNRLSQFGQIRASGLIAMKLEEEGERLVAVRTCRPDQDVLLATRRGRVIRFAVNELRVFASRGSTGVRGISLVEPDDEVISLSILTHVEVTGEEREGFIRQRRALAGEPPEEGAADLGVADGIVLDNASGEEIRPEDGAPVDGAAADGSPEDSSSEDVPPDEPDAILERTDGAPGPGSAPPPLPPERFAELAALEEMLLTVSDRGFGLRSSAYRYRTTGRGGQGLRSIDLSKRKGGVVACFPVEPGNQLMMVTDAGQIIRIRTDEIRETSRGGQGVRLFRVAPDEKIVSVTRVPAGLNGDVPGEEVHPEGADPTLETAPETAPDPGGSGATHTGPNEAGDDDPGGTGPAGAGEDTT